MWGMSVKHSNNHWDSDCSCLSLLAPQRHDWLEFPSLYWQPGVGSGWGWSKYHPSPGLAAPAWLSRIVCSIAGTNELCKLGLMLTKTVHYPLWSCEPGMVTDVRTSIVKLLTRDICWGHLTTPRASQIQDFNYISTVGQHVPSPHLTLAISYQDLTVSTADGLYNNISNLQYLYESLSV